MLFYIILYLIIIFLLLLIFYINFRYIIISNNNIINFDLKLNELKKYIPHIKNIGELNLFLKNNFSKLFDIKYINIKLFGINDNSLEIYKYFKKYNYGSYSINGIDLIKENNYGSYFINDIDFIQKNNHKFNKKLLIKQINKKSYLILPLLNNQNLIGILEIGIKPFLSKFGINEIKVFKNFANYIELHLQYLEIYSQVNLFNIDLDKKIDEKTIEYINLINNQKEFIQITSHEIKSLVTSSVFYLDFLIEDIKEDILSTKKIKDKLIILNKKFINLGELINNIFKIEEYDIKKIKLFKEKINLNKLLNTEIELLKTTNKNLKVNIEFDQKIGYVDIDKIQFRQVIDNLLNNAIKFSSGNNQIINITSKLNNNIIILSIDDNGIGFKNIKLENIFDKYNKGDISSEGIGMGLYLCKRIIEMHKGKIYAKNSDFLSGASFVIELPFL